MPYAYDPTTGEDVEIPDCHHVHAAESADDLGDRVVEIIRRTFTHDPVEGCQGAYTLLIRGECPECGSNRLREAVHTLPGFVHLYCPACETVVDR